MGWFTQHAEQPGLDDREIVRGRMALEQPNRESGAVAGWTTVISLLQLGARLAVVVEEPWGRNARMAES